MNSEIPFTLILYFPGCVPEADILHIASVALYRSYESWVFISIAHHWHQCNRPSFYDLCLYKCQCNWVDSNWGCLIKWRYRKYMKYNICYNFKFEWFFFSNILLHLSQYFGNNLLRPKRLLVRPLETNDEMKPVDLEPRPFQFGKVDVQWPPTRYVI